MVYEINHDEGEKGKKELWGSKEELEEPKQPGKDTISCLSIKMGSEKKVH